MVRLLVFLLLIRSSVSENPLDFQCKVSTRLILWRISRWPWQQREKQSSKGVLLSSLHSYKLLLIWLTYGNVTNSIWQACSCLSGARSKIIFPRKISSTAAAAIGITISLSLWKPPITFPSTLHVVYAKQVIQIENVSGLAILPSLRYLMAVLYPVSNP